MYKLPGVTDTCQSVLKQVLLAIEMLITVETTPVSRDAGAAPSEKEVKGSQVLIPGDITPVYTRYRSVLISQCKDIRKATLIKRASNRH